MTNIRAEKVLLLTGNSFIALGWIRVLWTLISCWIDNNNNNNNNNNNIKNVEDYMPLIYARLVQALGLSCLELVHCLLGFTKSNPVFVAFFLTIRGGVEYILGSSDNYHWTHLYTITCWCLGESIRFASFALAEIFEPNKFKWIRYTAGPIMFTLGAFGEMIMVAHTAQTHNNNPWIWFASSLWPLGFYPLMKQLLRQRRKFIKSINNKDEPLKKQS